MMALHNHHADRLPLHSLVQQLGPRHCSSAFTCPFSFSPSRTTLLAPKSMLRFLSRRVGTSHPIMRKIVQRESE